jgi:hypothetical protein
MDSPRSADFSSLIQRLTLALRSQGLAFMLIGGQAVLVHGAPRLTLDIDVTLAASPDELDRVLGACRVLGLRVLPDDPQSFSKETFVMPAADEETNIRVDFIFSSTLYEEAAIERAILVDIGGMGVPFASAEDLILHKVFAARPRDLEDAVGVVHRKGSSLDWKYILEWGDRFAEVPGCEGMPRTLRELRDRMRRQG